MKIEWKRKISSRKFWSLIVGFVSSLLLAFNLDENTIAHVSAVISSFGLIAVYILAEASVDKANVNKKDSDEE